MARSHHDGSCKRRLLYLYRSCALQFACNLCSPEYTVYMSRSLTCLNKPITSRCLAVHQDPATSPNQNVLAGSIEIRASPAWSLSPGRPVLIPITILDLFANPRTAAGIWRCVPLVSAPSSRPTSLPFPMASRILED